LTAFPGNISQAKIMEDMIDVRKVFHLACPNRETLFVRLKKARPER
jgi:adenylate kinase